MTQAEFRDWLAYHKAKFTGLVRWMAGFPEHATDRSPSRSDVMASWFRTLSACDLSAAKAATDQLGSDQHPEPKGWDRHPIAIAAMCRGERREQSRENSHARPMPRVIGGHSVYVCNVCRDTGDVDVWHPRTMQAARNGRVHQCAEQGELYRVSVACANCQAFSPARYAGIEFDPARMLPAPMVLQDGLEELQRFVDARLVEQRTWSPDGALSHLDF